MQPYETTADIPGATCDDQSTPERMAEVVAPVDGCDDVGDAPQRREMHVQSSTEVEDVGERVDDMAAMPCGEDDVIAQVPAP